MFSILKIQLNKKNYGHSLAEYALPFSLIAICAVVILLSSQWLSNNTSELDNSGLIHDDKYAINTYSPDLPNGLENTSGIAVTEVSVLD